MKKAFVLDVSACIPWCCEDETTPASEETLEWAMQGSELHVPSLWLWEIVNVVGVIVKRKRITSESGKEFLALLGKLNFRIAPAPLVIDLPRLQTLTHRYELTAYDAAYLDLAMRMSLPLATRDGDLRKAALAEGVDVLGE